MLILQSPDGEILLTKRPAAGIWGGLWSLPELPANSTAAEFSAQHFGIDLADQQTLDSVSHNFTHYNLLISPVFCKVSTIENRIMDAEGVLWYNLQRPQTIGLPAIISKILAVMPP